MIGSDLSATSKSLFFDFSGVDAGGFAELNFLHQATGICLTAANQDQCTGNPSTFAIGVFGAGYVSPVETGVVQIVSVVPEAAIWSMMVAGMFSIGWLMRSKHRQARTTLV